MEEYKGYILDHHESQYEERDSFGERNGVFTTHRSVKVFNLKTKKVLYIDTMEEAKDLIDNKIVNELLNDQIKAEQALISNQMFLLDQQKDEINKEIFKLRDRNHELYKQLKAIP